MDKKDSIDSFVKLEHTIYMRSPRIRLLEENNSDDFFEYC